MAREHIHLWGSVAVPPWEHPVGVVPTWDWFPSRQGDAGHNSWSKYLFLSLCTKKKKKILFPAKSQTLLHQFLSDEVKVWNLEPQAPAALLDLSTPGIQRFRSETEQHTAAVSELSPPLPFTNCRDTKVTQQKRACCPSHGREGSALTVFMELSIPPFVCPWSLHREDADTVWASVRGQALRWALSHSLSH